MIINLWNRNMVVSEEMADKIREYMRPLVSDVEGVISISTAVELVRSDLRINFPTNHNDAMSTFKALGFTIGRIPQKKNPQMTRVWYVTL